MGDKLTIRDWVDSDMEKLAQFHREMGPRFPLPESFGPLFAVRKAVVDENGEVVALATVKLIGEAYIWLNTSESGFKRAKCVKLLNESCSQEASRLGIDEVSAWIPPKLMRCFKGALAKLGWRKSPWRNWSFLIK